MTPPTNPVPLKNEFVNEWLARELGAVLTDTREPVAVVPNRADRRRAAREARRGR
jgi:hypothetical protein